MRKFLVVLFVLLLVVPAAAQDDAVFTLQHSDVVTVATWNSDESLILTAAADGFVRTWDAQSGEMVLEIAERGPVRGAMWSADETEILTWTDMGFFAIWDSRTAKPVYEASDAVMAPLNGAAFSPEAGSFVVWSEAGNLTMVRYRIDGEAADDGWVIEHETPLIDGGWLDDGAFVYTLEQSGLLHVYNSATTEEVATLRFDGETLGVDWTSDEERLLTWGGDGLVTIWQIDGTNQSIERVLNHARSFVSGAAWTDDETRLTSWGADETARIWDVASGDRQLMVRHEDWVTGVALNSEETRILTLSFDTAFYWDVATGDLIMTYTHDNLVSGGAISADGSQILTWSWDGTARVWDAP